MCVYLSIYLSIYNVFISCHKDRIFNIGWHYSFKCQVKIHTYFLPNFYKHKMGNRICCFFLQKSKGKKCLLPPTHCHVLRVWLFIYSTSESKYDIWSQCSKCFQISTCTVSCRLNNELHHNHLTQESYTISYFMSPFLSSVSCGEKPLYLWSFIIIRSTKLC